MENCIICERKINFNKDKYVKLTDFEGKKEVSHCFYHLDCWKNRFTITQQKIQEQANEWMKNLGVVINNIKGVKNEIQV